MNPVPITAAVLLDSVIGGTNLKDSQYGKIAKTEDILQEATKVTKGFWVRDSLAFDNPSFASLASVIILYFVAFVIFPYCYIPPRPKEPV